VEYNTMMSTHAVLGQIRRNWMALLLFALGAAVRLLQYGRIPPGLNQDEASIGYDAYAILNFGIDRNGIHNPVHLIAWGSGQNALYAYLDMPFIYLFGLTPLSVRAVNAIFGLADLVAFYFLLLRTGGGRPLALIGLFLLVISPWHIMMSRWALESNLFPSLVLIAVFLLYLSLRRNNWFPSACFVFALSLYAYGTSYFFVPVFLLCVVIYVLSAKRIRPPQVIGGLAVFGLCAVPIVLFILINRLQLPSIDAGFFTIPRLASTPRFVQVSSVFGGQVLRQGAHNFSRFLHVFMGQDDGLPWNAIPPYGFLYFLCMPLLFIGLGICMNQLIYQKSGAALPLLVWFGVAVLMAFVMDVNINRINIIYFPAIFLAACGVHGLHQRIRGSLVVLAVVFGACFGQFSVEYFTRYPQAMSSVFCESFGEALTFAAGATDGQISVTDRVNMPYIFALFYERGDPGEFQQTVRYSNTTTSPLPFVSSFGRYRFGIGDAADAEVSAYVITPAEEAAIDSTDFELTRFKHYSVAVRRR